MTICRSAIEACKNAEAVVIATEWKEFLEIDWEEVYKGMNKPAFVFDGRLLVDAEKLTKIGFKVCFIFAFCLSGGLNNEDCVRLLLLAALPLLLRRLDFGIGRK